MSDNFKLHCLPAEPPFTEIIPADIAARAQAILTHVKAHWLRYGDGNQSEYFTVKSIENLKDGSIKVEYRFCTPSEKAIAKLENEPPDDWVALDDLKVVRIEGGFQVINDFGQLIAIIPGQEKETDKHMSLIQSHSIAERLTKLLTTDTNLPE